MAYKCSFLDSEIYSAQDVNDIFARITSGGVVFTDTGYTFSDLNSAQTDAVDGGITKDINSCKVVKYGSTYKISKGACFMNDGSAITFDEDGQEIQIISGVLNYVYLSRNTVANSIDIVVSETSGDKDTIPLAEITSSGEVLDRRKYARAKVNLATTGDFRDFSASFSECNSGRSETVTVDMGDGAFNYLVMWDGNLESGNSSTRRVPSGQNLIPLIEGESVMLSIGRNPGDETEVVYIKKDGQKLHMYILNTVNFSTYTLNLGVL